MMEAMPQTDMTLSALEFAEYAIKLKKMLFRLGRMTKPGALLGGIDLVRYEIIIDEISSIKIRVVYETTNLYGHTDWRSETYDFVRLHTLGDEYVDELIREYEIKKRYKVNPWKPAIIKWRYLKMINTSTDFITFHNNLEDDLIKLGNATAPGKTLRRISDVSYFFDVCPTTNENIIHVIFEQNIYGDSYSHSMRYSFDRLYNDRENYIKELITIYNGGNNDY